MVARRPTIYYIRHGETDWNVAGRLQGRHDISLNARGRAQAVHCGDALARPVCAQRLRPPPNSTMCQVRSGGPAKPWSCCGRHWACRPTATTSSPGLPRLLSAIGKGSASRNCARVIRSASRRASRTNGTSSRLAGRATRLCRGGCATGMKAFRATPWQSLTAGRRAD